MQRDEWQIPFVAAIVMIGGVVSAITVMVCARHLFLSFLHMCRNLSPRH